LSKSTVFDQERLAKLLTEKYKVEVDAKALPFNKIEFIDQEIVEFKIKNTTYSLNLDSYLIDAKEEQEKDDVLEQLSPDGEWIAFSKNYNIYLRSVTTGKEYALSTSGKKYFEYAMPYEWDDIIEGEEAERPQNFRVEWSPDSKRILTSIWDFQGANKMYLLDWSIEDRYRPKLLSYYRGSPGENSLVKVVPVIFDVESKSEIPIDLPSLTHINSAKIKWNPDSQSLVGYYYERGFKKLHFFTINSENGQVEKFYTEEKY
jgi:dipeptidyl-peptidase-4